jgi:CheY-like chemotaxis protein
MSNYRRRHQRAPRLLRSAQRRPSAIDRDLIELQRLAMVGQLFSETAHEINSLLELACNFLQVEAEGSAKTDRPDSHLQTVFDLAMIARDAALTVTEFSWPAPVDGQQTLYAIETVLRLFERRLANHARLHLFGMESLAPVALPAGHLQLVLASIVRNALDAVEGTEDGQIRLTASRTPGWLALEVWNSGPHIPKGVMDRLFDGTISTKTRGRNIGLGMSMSNQLVKSVGGRLDAWNDPSGGVAFRIRVPITCEDFQPASLPDKPSSQRPSPATWAMGGKSTLAGRQILVVDDCEPAREAVKVLLREMSGATVQTCASGEQALELVATARQIDAVVLDMHLPRLSSQETFNRLPAPVRERVIFLTHDGLERGLTRFLEVSPQPRLCKPVRYAALIEAIQSVWDS